MGLCEYCGTQAGFIRHSHRACEELFEQGIRKIEPVVAKSPLSLGCCGSDSGTGSSPRSGGRASDDSLGRGLGWLC